MTQCLDAFLDGVVAGRLTQVPGGTVTSCYDDGHTTPAQPNPLSLSMPLTRSRHLNGVLTSAVKVSSVGYGLP